MKTSHRLGAVTAGATALAVAASVLAGSAAVADDDGPVESSIYVEKVDGLSDDFINGVDVSSVLSLEDSGVVFRHDDGTPGDLFEILKEHGITDVRVRVWNDPYDSEGNGYGGGTVDAARALEIGERATDAGLHVTVNFHYADFWAHPGQQPAPKAWTGLTVAEKADATYDFTHDTLAAMAAADVDVTMVQVGNETNNGQVAGASGWANFVTITNGGSAAVRDTYPDALVAVHFTNPETQNYWNIAQHLQNNGMDYDVFASSYYPYWHGTLANLTDKLYWVAEDFDKKVMVAETSYAYTLEDGDGHSNTVRVGANDSGPYPTSVQGQATAVRDVIQAVADIGEAGLGVYYWEPAWLPVGPADQVEANKVLWERDGSGWASSFAGEYSTDAGTYYGGSSWDNQALFDFDGNPLASLNIFDYARTGAVAPLEVTSVENPTVTVTYGDTISLPSTVTVTYNDSSTEQQSVTWNDVLSWITSPGTYKVKGVTEDGLGTTATVVVKPVNYLVNGGFETGNDTGWSLSADPWPSTYWIYASAGNNAIDTYAVNAYNATAYTFRFEQTVTGLEPGAYVATGRAHGADVTPQFFATTSQGTLTQTPALTGWAAWKSPSIAVTVPEDGAVTVGVNGTGLAGGWAWFDEFTLIKAPVAGADTSELQALVTQMNSLARSVYSADSLAALDSALEIANIVLAAASPTAGQVADATELVSEAFDALVVTGEVPDPTVNPVVISAIEGDPITLPNSVTVTAFDGRTQQESVTWDDVLGWIDGPGVYTVHGVTEGGRAATATVTVTERNWVVNGSFEDDDTSMWTVDGAGAAIGWSGDSAAGDKSVAFWLDSDYTFSVSQQVSGLPAGNYQLSATTQGGDSPETDTREVVLWNGTSGEASQLALEGWQSFETATTAPVAAAPDGTLSVRAEFTLTAGAWGTVDDFRLVRAANNADTTALEALVAQAGDVERALYTDASLAALDGAVAAANVVLSADNPSQAKVTAAADNLQAALDGLDLIDVEFTTAPTPTVSGTAKVGSTLTATAGTWVPTPSALTYEWRRDGVAIAGATTTKYVLTKADAGRTITVAVTGSKADFVTTTKVSTGVKVQSIFTKAPKPTISGKPIVGAKLTAKLGTWSPAPTKVTYQWKVGTKVVSTKSTYTVKKADLGKKVTVTVTGSRTGFTPVTQTSTAVKVVKKFTSTGYASITGTVKVGKVLTAHRGVWKPAPTSYTYQWYRNGVAILGANGVNYKLTSADKGKKITVKVTAKKAGYLSTSHTSPAKTVK